MNISRIVGKPYGRLALAMFLAAAAATVTVAHDAKEDTIHVVQQHRLPDVPGKSATMITVSYLPGEASKAHVHPGSVFAYVLEGAITSQLEGGKPVTYKAGEGWYEPPRAPHLVSRNASDKAPAKLLAILLGDDGAALKEPYPSK